MSSRRSFLGYLLSFLALGTACSEQKDGINNLPISLGKMSDFIGKETEVSLYRLVVFSDDQGLRAVKTVCTHQSCALNRNLNGFTCPCHGSRFSKTGDVLTGPAKKSLIHLKLSVTEDRELLVWPREEVGVSWRLSA